MTARIIGGRIRVHGLTMSQGEIDCVDDAVNDLPPERSESRVEYIRNAALMRARDQLRSKRRKRAA